MKLETGYGHPLPGAFVIETRKSSGIFFAAPAAASETLCSEAFTNVSVGVLHVAVGNIILHCVYQLDVADGVGILLDRTRYTFVAFAADTCRLQFGDAPAPTLISIPG